MHFFAKKFAYIKNLLYLCIVIQKRSYTNQYLLTKSCKCSQLKTNIITIIKIKQL